MAPLAWGRPSARQSTLVRLRYNAGARVRRSCTCCEVAFYHAHVLALRSAGWQMSSGCESNMPPCCLVDSPAGLGFWTARDSSDSVVSKLRFPRYAHVIRCAAGPQACRACCDTCLLHSHVWAPVARPCLSSLSSHTPPTSQRRPRVRVRPDPRHAERRADAAARQRGGAGAAPGARPALAQAGCVAGVHQGGWGAVEGRTCFRQLLVAGSLKLWLGRGLFQQDPLQAATDRGAYTPCHAPACPAGAVA